MIAPTRDHRKRARGNNRAFPQFIENCNEINRPAMRGNSRLR
jgi:hypothetical protein